MAQADSKQRLWMLHTDHLAQVADGGLAELGVPGAVTDKQTVKLCSTEKQQRLAGETGGEQRKQTFGSGCGTCAVQRVVPGYHGNAGSPLSQAADLVVLDATVHHCDPQTSAGVEDSGLLETKAKETVFTRHRD